MPRCNAPEFLFSTVPTPGSTVEFWGGSVRKNHPLVPQSNIAGSWARGAGGGGVCELSIHCSWPPDPPTHSPGGQKRLRGWRAQSATLPTWGAGPLRQTRGRRQSSGVTCHGDFPHVTGSGGPAQRPTPAHHQVCQTRLDQTQPTPMGKSRFFFHWAVSRCCWLDGWGYVATPTPI